MLFSHVKIPSFRAKAHLVFHWCLYNNKCYNIHWLSLQIRGVRDVGAKWFVSESGFKRPAETVFYSLNISCLVSYNTCIVTYIHTLLT